MKRQVGRRTLAASCVLLSVAMVLGVGAWIPGASAQRLPESDLDVVQLRPDFYVIGGAGGNIVMQTGPQGVILVDSGSTEMADKVLATIRRLTPLPIRYIINTSMDADHVGGNEKLSKAGRSILPGAVAAGAGLGGDPLAHLGAGRLLRDGKGLTRT